FFARGGHGVLRVLDRIDWSLLARHPRAYVGYSDLTPFLNALVDRLSIVSFHGPMVAVEMARGLEPAEEHALLEALAGEFPVERKLQRRLVPGAAKGILMGGCLTLLAATLGTSFATRFTGRVLFFEDVGEPPYRVDRMLTQLRLSGTLDDVRGVVIGGSLPASDEGQGEWRGEARELLNDLQVPVAAGLSSGHETPNLTVPLGVDVQLSGEEMHLIFGSSSPSGEGS
ncbi:MAG TPA: LD-carboxypeptidase, partial [Thermoanaerobaculia bacterium]|nr:LD-carboxypeptidase [Thermoanaerobaculia bacterium]